MLKSRPEEGQRSKFFCLIIRILHASDPTSGHVAQYYIMIAAHEPTRAYMNINEIAKVCFFKYWRDNLLHKR